MRLFTLLALISVISLLISCASPSQVPSPTPASSSVMPSPEKTATPEVTPTPQYPLTPAPVKETVPPTSTPTPVGETVLPMPTPAPAKETILPTPTPTPTPTPAKATATPTPAKEQTPIPLRRGTVDNSIEVVINQSEKTWAGTTILADNHDLTNPRIIEVNMLGEIVWQYQVPMELRGFTNPGFDIEPLPNGNILFVLPRNGIYEVDRKGNVVWSYLDRKVSHDADRLPNGNTLVAYGAFDGMDDVQVKEISPQGRVVWTWYARDHFNKAPYKDIFNEGWTHTNAVTRLSNGNTLISLRNFHIIVEVDPKGSVIRTIGEGILSNQHDPEMLPNGNILMADHSEPQRAIELDPKTNRIVWQHIVPRQLVRDANRLPNGNTLITGATMIIEVTSEGKIVWQLNLKDIVLSRTDAASQGFYKAERISAQ